ncbi:MAG: Major facilitator superfamily 1, partial [Solirubrobacterales bacterium]|nr:Major facilitator superfamily 1 [Solirubrobacterales bacterium]
MRAMRPHALWRPCVPEADAAYRVVTDGNGRQYRVGESAEQILGRSRVWMMWLPWLAMMAVSVFEYGYGAAAATLQSHNDWDMSEAFWIVTIWAVFQPLVAFPAGRLRERSVITVRVAMLVAAVLSAIGFLTIANSGEFWVVLLGYSVLGGTGAGLVYASCINLVGKWFPEKRGARTGFVNGGFAYGTLPFVYVFSFWFHPSNFALVLNLIAVYMLVVIGACGMLLKDPPKNWWPAEVDPLRWVEQRRAAGARTASRNPPAVAQFTPLQAIRTGQLPLMWLALWMIGNVSLFGSAYQVPFAKSLGFGPMIAASSAGVLVVVNGTGRAVVGWVSDRLGRKQTLIAVLLIEAVAQVGLLYGGKAHLEVPFLAMAFLAGFGGGAFFPLFAALVPDYFGENNNAQNYGAVYSSKLASSLVGIGLGSSVIHALGYTGAYLIGAALALLSAAIVLLLHQPRELPAPAAAAREPVTLRPPRLLGPATVRDA